MEEIKGLRLGLNKWAHQSYLSLCVYIYIQHRNIYSYRQFSTADDWTFEWSKWFLYGNSILFGKLWIQQATAELLCRTMLETGLQRIPDGPHVTKLW